MNEQRNDEMEIDLRELFYVLLGKMWIIILATALGLGVAAGYTTAFVQPIYSSTSMLYVMGNSTSLTSLMNIQIGSSLTQDYQVFITSRPVVDKVIKDLELDTTYEDFIENVSVENPSSAHFIYITVKNPDAYMAKTIVDKLTDVFTECVETVMGNAKPNVVDYGHIPESQTSPNLAKNALVGGLLGFALSITCILVLYLMNDSIQTAEDVEKYLGLNTLGLIPLEESISKRRTRGHNKDAAKARRARRKQRETSSAED